MMPPDFTPCGRCRAWLAVALLAGLVSGCAMVGPDYGRPPVKVEQTWMETADKRVQTASANYKDWWQAFKDPALNRLIDSAYRENLTLQIAGVRVLRAQAQLGVAVGGFYPQTQQGLGGYTRTRLSQSDPRSDSAPIGNWIFGGNSAGASNPRMPLSTLPSPIMTMPW